MKMTMDETISEAMSRMLCQEGEKFGMRKIRGDDTFLGQLVSYDVNIHQKIKNNL